MFSYFLMKIKVIQSNWNKQFIKIVKNSCDKFYWNKDGTKANVVNTN